VVLHMRLVIIGVMVMILAVTIIDLAFPDHITVHDDLRKEPMRTGITEKESQTIESLQLKSIRAEREDCVTWYLSWHITPGGRSFIVPHRECHKTISAIPLTKEPLK
jgi:hypothetical protein